MGIIMLAEQRAVLAFSVIMFLIFSFFPSLDLPVSQFVMTNPLFDLPMLWRLIFYAVYWGSFVVVLGLIVMLIQSYRYGGKPGLRFQSVLFFLLCWIVGPLLIVNVILKDHVGRPRPYSVLELRSVAVEPETGHNRAQTHYVPPFVFSHACDKNCSFVSGHASAGFVFVALGYVYTQYRRRIMWLSCLAGGIIGLARIAQGAHFLSDVIFSFVFTYLGVFVSFVFVKYQLGFTLGVSPASSDN